MINLENNEKFKELEKNYIILCNFTDFSLDLAFGYFDYLIKMREKIPIKVISRGKLKNHPKDYYKYYTSKRIPKRVIKNKKDKELLLQLLENTILEQLKLAIKLFMKGKEMSVKFEVEIIIERNPPVQFNIENFLEISVHDIEVFI